MSSAGSPLIYVCRSCRQNVRRASQTPRSFSTTAARSKVIPSFAPTPFPELDELLLTWRHKVFMPAALQNHHRALIYKKSRHQTLLNEPGVTVTMSDDEEIKLEPMNYFDKPNKQKSLRTIAEFLSNTNSDAVWKNLPSFLSGMVLAKQKIPTYFYQKITRKAGENGKERIIILCAEKAEETGLKLSKGTVAKELMLAFHTRAALAGFKGGELEAAMRRAEKVVRMLEDELYDADKLKEDEVDARKSPLVASVMTELAAAKAIEGQDSDVAKVANYATKMLHLAAKEPHTGLDHPPKGDGIRETRAAANIELENLLPMQNAIKLALELEPIKNSQLGKELTEKLRSVTDEVEKNVKVLRDTADGEPRRGLEMYDQIHGTEYNPVAANEADGKSS
ncbi:hypothetical protein HRR83_009059 [Exophiala dermatitidis]|uniref:Uncharacterized protein n=2 Tax=Exophiala dermatitidis TaxID=5970 RepID=H6BWR7_EXODN|nr:uncharacterized protein HMPREF1120_03403 [Exophiala dermatitidis NIH/UT8656]KAJ4503188.1 hypothetical protein HRR73_009199 [Exophiala dermatitidis]EHY55258.1 hypothetical protein HMPREF1120_03403 [Exophiala dermatitidis NIH/UT8656]KAJ4506145.1 hypothetical protein HRR75_007000 [Exophiala dermatitidis]KAJ4508232.1 hypothetical protein HRR74_007631 [Exophiala dermatitidis]KAJ4533234.1 hypothetical protein HRR77_008766 [Exophiala dermatitidis]